MLYVTTRNNGDAFTAHRTMTNQFGPDGGSFVPFRMPVFDNAQLLHLKEKSFNENVAEILNLFFSTQLTSWDLDFGIGRNLLRISAMNQKILIAELWHNLEGNYDYLESMLFQKIAPEPGADITKWSQIAIRVAVLFGIYGQMLRQNLVRLGEHFAFSVRNDDFVTPIAALYCREMGMPINTVVCACNEEGNLWDFIHRGFLNTATIPANLQIGVERLLHLVFGCNVAADFSAACEQKRTFSIEEKDLPQLNDALFCSVSGKERAQSIINSLFRTNAYIIDDDAALSYGGLQDYRAKVGDGQLIVILAEKTPLSCVNEITDATGLDADMINKHINQA